MACSGTNGVDRRYERLTRSDLERLASIASVEQDSFFRRNPHREYQRRRLLLAGLCQGAARHFVDRRNGVKDFDIHFFYWRPVKERHMRCRRRVEHFVGAFGRRPIDFLRTSIRVRERVETVVTPEASLEVVRRFLRERPTAAAWRLAKNPVIRLLPVGLLGEVVWSPRMVSSERPSTS